MPSPQPTDPESPLEFLGWASPPRGADDEARRHEVERAFGVAAPDAVPSTRAERVAWAHAVLREDVDPALPQRLAAIDAAYPGEANRPTRARLRVACLVNHADVLGVFEEARTFARAQVRTGLVDGAGHVVPDATVARLTLTEAQAATWDRLRALGGRGSR